MILSDLAIFQKIQQERIIILPFDESCLGSNSYDVHLSMHLATYVSNVLDAKVNNELTRLTIPEQGMVLYPDELYLGSTIEYTETHDTVPFLEGKSSTGRLGIDIHATAGKGDVGFKGHWTLEISVKKPVRIYAGMPIGQLIYFPVQGEVQTMYNHKANAKYNNTDILPMGSAMWKNKF